MPQTLYIGDSIKVIFDRRDFVDLVEQTLGIDARNYLEELIGESESIAEKHKRELEQAYRDGLEEGAEDNSFHSYSNGHEDGYEEGREAGYREGYVDGVRDGCEKMRRF